MDASGFDDNGYGANALLREVQSDRKQSLKVSRSGYKGHLTRLYRDIEALLVSRGNYKLVEDKLRNLNSAFANYEQAHSAYIECIDDPEELQVASVTYEAELKKKQEFNDHVLEWLNNAQIDELSSELQPNDSISQAGTSLSSKRSHRSSSSSSSRMGVKIKVPKAEKAIAQLKLHQLKKTLELKQKRDAMQREQELLDAENEVERATLKAHILEEEDDLGEFVNPSTATADVKHENKTLAPSYSFEKPLSSTISAKHEKNSTPVPVHVTLNPAAPE